MTYPNGPGRPVVSGVGDMSIDEFLKDPSRIQRTIDAIPGQYFIADYLLRQGEAKAGTVVYDQLTDLDLYVNTDDNRQPGVVQPGDEFSAVGLDDGKPNVALVAKIGAYFTVTDEQGRRDRRDVVRRGIRRVSNTIRQIENAKAVTAITDDSVVSSTCTTDINSTSTKWDATSGTPDPIADIRAAIAEIDYNDLGYDTDTALIHPDVLSVLQGNDAVNKLLPRETPELNPILSKELAGLCGLNWIVNKRVPRTTVLFTQRQMVGELASEIPPFTEVIDERARQRQRVQSGRVSVPVVTDPHAVQVLTNVIS